MGPNVPAVPADVPFSEWLKRVPALFPNEQVKAVINKLKERNPAFDGNHSSSAQNGVVVELRIKCVSLNRSHGLESLIRFDNSSQ